MKSIKEMQARKPVELQPHGMNKYDLGALSDDQQVKLTTFKIRQRLQNEEYIRKHPEMQFLIHGFMRELLLKKPEDVRQFAADHFLHPELPMKIKEQVARQQDNTPTKCPFLSTSDVSTNHVEEFVLNEIGALSTNEVRECDEESGDAASSGDSV